MMVHKLATSWFWLNIFHLASNGKAQQIITYYPVLPHMIINLVGFPAAQVYIKKDKMEIFSSLCDYVISETVQAKKLPL